MRDICKNILITVITCIFLLLATEVYFRLFMAQSDGLQFTLISKAWFQKYWHPVNSFGYRDLEHTEDSLKGKKIIFVVGDSFVAGQGIKNYQDRFSNLLQDKLGGGVAVINIAKCDWSTEDEYKAIRTYPYDPDIIIVMYLANDIQGSARKIGVESVAAVRSSSAPVIKYLINNSYFLNYLYYRLYVNFSYKSLDENIRGYYLNKRVFEKHQETLINIIDYAESINARLFFIFPKFNDPKLDFIFNLIEFIKTNKVGVIDMGEKYTLLDEDKKDLRVSRIDGHPNEKANKIFADTIFEYIKNNKLLETAVSN